MLFLLMFLVGKIKWLAVVVALFPTCRCALAPADVPPPISTWCYKNRVCEHFVNSLNYPCLIASLLSCSLMFFFSFVLWGFVVRDLCRSGCRQNFHRSLTVSMLLLVTLRNVSRRAWCKALKWDKVITINSQSLHHPISYCVLVSFG